MCEAGVRLEYSVCEAVRLEDSVCEAGELNKLESMFVSYESQGFLISCFSCDLQSRCNDTQATDAIS